ncbi:potassium transporter TrkA [Pseudothermotoga hypogea DSM 11164 = NBRC 106472]|uniref:Potassium transporter TrkA n=2 Tax=Pseudothermotoga hypogea TaxID=57487 RepID=A0A0X1KQH2_9THEM|nr:MULTISPECIES: TrkA family potassium uptake protein [Pseudothermotoga]AJC73471.1 potassium transporter TrkA [Pseudothermotoga hypogea DSM 11164 = NBRC 106472]MBC7122375.1 TrkA family potassium uptake protein [Pseudothermotoga sp.]MDI6862957.1 TrkA family potassium uptake protein [Pseudothermotoga sp.]
MKKTESLYVVIAGCGRIGSIVATSLSVSGSNVVVIDTDETALENLPEEFTGFKINGDVTEISVLREARLDKADVLVALTGDDNTNFMVSTVAKRFFGVKRVIARVNDPSNEDIFKEFDIDIVSPTRLTAMSILRELGVRET